MFETIFVIIGIVLFIAYNVFMVSVNGWELPESISATSYLSRERFGTTMPFTLICVVSAVCLFPLWVSASPVCLQFLAFLSCAGILFAGSTPLYREEFESRVHYTGGIVAFVCGVLWLLLTSNWAALLAIAGTGGLWTVTDRDKYTFIFEVVGYLAMCFAVLAM